MSRWEFTKGKGKQPYRARLVSSNGRVLCWTEGYARKGSRLKAVRAIMKACGGKLANVRILDDPKRTGLATVSGTEFRVYPSILV